VIVESLAIWLHLADLHPQAGLAPPPGHPKRAEYMGWLGLSTAVFEQIVVAAMNGTPLTERQQAARASIDARFAVALARGPSSTPACPVPATGGDSTCPWGETFTIVCVKESAA